MWTSLSQWMASLCLADDKSLGGDNLCLADDAHHTQEKESNYNIPAHHTSHTTVPVSNASNVTDPAWLITKEVNKQLRQVGATNLHRADTWHLHETLGTCVAHSPDTILTEARKLWQLHKPNSTLTSSTLVANSMYSTSIKPLSFAYF